MERAVPLLGLFCFLGVAWLLSEKKSAIRWRTVGWGLALQLIFALLIIGMPALGFDGPLKGLFSTANDIVVALLGYTAEGSRFVFGPLMDTENGFIFAIQVLPTIIFVSTLTAMAYHMGLMQKIVQGIAWVMLKTMGTSGAESLSAAANIFIGQTEAPLLIRPFIEKMTRSELMAVMTAGMATVAGGVLAAYVGLLYSRIPDIAGHLITASVLSAPAALVIAKLLVPETASSETAGRVQMDLTRPDRNLIESAARGAAEGLVLALNVGAMLLAFIALIALANGLLGWVGNLIEFAAWGPALLPESVQTAEPLQLSFQLILGLLFSPVAWIMGIPWAEASAAGALLGEKLILNEFVAYLHLSEMEEVFSDRSILILSYALCGFANFSSIAIQVGGIGGIAPSRRSELASLGIKAVLGGTLAAFMTATVAGLLI